MNLNLSGLLNNFQELNDEFWKIEHLNTLDSLLREPAHEFLKMVSTLQMIW